MPKKNSQKQRNASILSCFIGIHDILVLSQLVGCTLCLGYILDFYRLKIFHHIRK
uniref:Uncharacterized protein n=1 Tax=Rhinopithecus bieti TaxID=61621 RepID=A0A2K6JU96_RHIBE